MVRFPKQTAATNVSNDEEEYHSNGSATRKSDRVADQRVFSRALACYRVTGSKTRTEVKTAARIDRPIISTARARLARELAIDVNGQTTTRVTGTYAPYRHVPIRDNSATICVICCERMPGRRGAARRGVRASSPTV